MRTGAALTPVVSRVEAKLAACRKKVAEREELKARHREERER